MLERYEIRAGRDAPCELWGICGVLEYMICDGTHTYCADVRQTGGTGMKYKVGDKVRIVTEGQQSMYWHGFSIGDIGTITNVHKDGEVLDVDVAGFSQCTCLSDVEPYTHSPVRTVTRKEIVPGWYGIVRVSYTGNVGIPTCTRNPAELRAAAATLIEIADALEEQKDD